MLHLTLLRLHSHVSCVHYTRVTQYHKLCVHYIYVILHTLSCNISVYDARTWNLHVYVIGINIASRCSTRKYNPGYIVCNKEFSMLQLQRKPTTSDTRAAFCLLSDKVTEQKMANTRDLHGHRGLLFLTSTRS
jgi:hypothetical protein